MSAIKPKALSGDEARRIRRKRFRIFAAVVGTAALAGGTTWFLTRNIESTDDAFIEANVVQVAPQVGGVVAAVHFSDNQWVEAGQLLVEIDPRDYDVQRASAAANLEVAQAQSQAAQADLDLTKATTGAAIDQARQAVQQAKQQVSSARQQADAAGADAVRAAADVKRYDDLFQKAVASKQRLEQAMADARSTNAHWRAAQMDAIAAQAGQAQAEARLTDALAAPQRVAQKEAQLANAKALVAQAQANLRGTELNLSYTRLVAPQAGRIGRRAVNAGDVVQKNQTLTNLVVDPPWITANFKETQLTRMHPDQPVSVSIDAFPGHVFHGHVESIQPGSGARFSLLPPENATGNYVKVVQRVPVKIVFDDLADGMVHRLSPGMSVVPEVDVGAKPDAPR
jgi:membrane fusion protein (multidrug efflux system)